LRQLHAGAQRHLHEVQHLRWHKRVQLMDIILLHIVIGWCISKLLDGLWAILKKTSCAMFVWLRRRSPVVLVSRKRMESLEAQSEALRVLVESGKALRAQEVNTTRREVGHGSD
jgi:hypothetical protein